MAYWSWVFVYVFFHLFPSKEIQPLPPPLPPKTKQKERRKGYPPNSADPAQPGVQSCPPPSSATTLRMLLAASIRGRVLGALVRVLEVPGESQAARADLISSHESNKINIYLCLYLIYSYQTFFKHYKFSLSLLNFILIFTVWVARIIVNIHKWPIERNYDFVIQA